MKKYFLIVLVFFCINLQPSPAQGFWSDLKDRVKDVSSQMLDPYRYTVPVTERKFLDVIPDDYLLSISEQQYRSYISPGKLSANSKETARVKNVSKKLASAVERFYRQRGMADELRGFKWEFNLI